MGYENDPYVDEDGEPLMDFDDDVQSDPEPQQGGDDRNLIDDEDEDDWRREERSPTPVYNQSESKSKPRKRLIKKSSAADEKGLIYLLILHQMIGLRICKLPQSSRFLCPCIRRLQIVRKLS